MTVIRVILLLATLGAAGWMIANFPHDRGGDGTALVILAASLIIQLKGWRW